MTLFAQSDLDMKSKEEDFSVELYMFFQDYDSIKNAFLSPDSHNAVFLKHPTCAVTS